MKRFYIISSFVLMAIASIAGILSDNGKAGKTGSPGELNCTDCHSSFSLNAGGGSISITSPNLTNWQYVPGQTYQINVTVARNTTPLFGFGFESLSTSNNTNAGTLVVTNSSQTQLKVATVSSVSRTNIVHKLNGGLSANTHTFSFNWTAPSTNIGNIKFYTAGVAANNNGNENSDYVYTTTQLITPQSATGINESISQSNSLIAFPNPAKDYFLLKGLTVSSNNKIQLFNLKGQLVQEVNKENILQGKDAKVELNPSLTNGIYLAKVTSANGATGLVKVFVEK